MFAVGGSMLPLALMYMVVEAFTGLKSALIVKMDMISDANNNLDNALLKNAFPHHPLFQSVNNNYGIIFYLKIFIFILCLSSGMVVSSFTFYLVLEEFRVGLTCLAARARLLVELKISGPKFYT
jgi:hypothetical protein